MGMAMDDHLPQIMSRFKRFMDFERFVHRLKKLIYIRLSINLINCPVRVPLRYAIV
jgi:hypothetical protein